MGVFIQATEQVQTKQLKSEIPPKMGFFYHKVTIAQQLYHPKIVTKAKRGGSHSLLSKVLGGHLTMSP